MVHPWPFSYRDWWKEEGGGNWSCVCGWQDVAGGGGSLWGWAPKRWCESRVQTQRQLRARASVWPGTVPKKMPGLARVCCADEDSCGDRQGGAEKLKRSLSSHWGRGQFSSTLSGTQGLNENLYQVYQVPEFWLNDVLFEIFFRPEAIWWLLGKIQTRVRTCFFLRVYLRPVILFLTSDVTVLAVLVV